MTLDRVPRHLIALVLCSTACGDTVTVPSDSLPESRIAFTLWHQTTSSGIYTVRPDGSDLRQLLTGAGLRYDPAWAPDRSQLVFIYAPANNLSQAEVRIVGADGSGERTILGPGSYSTPDWSPDGSEIVLAQDKDDGTRELIIISPSGTALPTLPDRHASDEDPAWSPDGQRLAFVSNCLAPGCINIISDLWVMNADGSSPLQLTAGVEYGDDAFSPVWSPDGQWLLFSMVRDNLWDLYRIRPTGADLERLTSTSITVRYFHPTYSPDGMSFAYTQWVGPGTGQTSLFVSQFDGSAPIRLSLPAGRPGGPAWAR